MQVRLNVEFHMIWKQIYLSTPVYTTTLMGISISIFTLKFTLFLPQTNIAQIHLGD